MYGNTMLSSFRDALRLSILPPSFQQLFIECSLALAGALCWPTPVQMISEELWSALCRFRRCESR